jgi:saccharopine dehydrogenase-like NADP-dependent oxidoreductase
VKKRILLLGLGMQGKAALHDLAKCDAVSEIVVADRLQALEDGMLQAHSPKITGIVADARDSAHISRLMAGADAVLDLLPSEFAYPMAELAVKTGVHLVNASYLTDPGEEDASRLEAARERLHQLDLDAGEKGVCVLPEFGMDPGIDLMLCHQAARDLDEVHELDSYGAGFPEIDAAGNPLKYKFTWSVKGVFKSYFRPARFLRDGRVVRIPAVEMFSPHNTHMLHLEELGHPLECFPNGDSAWYVHALGIEKTVRTMGRYICRWPGHGQFWNTMAKCGFLGDTPLKVGESEVSPADFLASLLGSQGQFWYAERERDVALIRADARGVKNGQRVRTVYQVIDRRDLATGFTAMARTTAFTASIGVQMILSGMFKPGIVSHKDVPFNLFEESLSARGIKLAHTREHWPITSDV